MLSEMFNSLGGLLGLRRQPKSTVISDATAAKRVLSNLEQFSRCEANVGIQQLFHISNVFTVEDEPYRRSVRRTLPVTYLRLDETRFLRILNSTEAAVEKFLQRGSTESPVGSLKAVEFCQYVTINTFAESFLGLRGFENEGVMAGTLVNELWSLKNDITNESIANKRDRLLTIIDAERAIMQDPDGVWSFLKSATEEATGNSAHQYADNLLNIIIPGYETMWRVLLYLLLEVQRNEPVHSQLVNCLDDVSSCLTLKNLRSTKFLECCVKETLRLYPPTKSIHRIVKREDTPPYIQGDKVVVNVEEINRSTTAWGPDALKFVPDHFKNVTSKQLSHFLSFGGGKTSCVAAREYAPLFVMIMVFTIFEKLDLAVTHIQDPEPLINQRTAYSDHVLHYELKSKNIFT